ncbi:hypothetical protein BU17DRAFT_71976 [Hysterangium stoloniferum]|nr:hypothetical protein BU17DRAFT_71976 [Hysterangium stoloniferum]
MLRALEDVTLIANVPSARMLASDRQTIMPSSLLQPVLVRPWITMRLPLNPFLLATQTPLKPIGFPYLLLSVLPCASYSPITIPRRFQTTVGFKSHALSLPMLNFSNTKHTLLPSLIPSSQMMMKTAFSNTYGQVQNQIQTSSPNQALAAIPRLVVEARGHWDPEAGTVCLQQQQEREGQGLMDIPHGNGASLGVGVSGWGQGRSRRHGSDHNSRSYPHNRNPSVASSTIEVPAPHRNTNYTPNLDTNIKPTSSDKNDNISVARHLGKTLKPSHLQSQSHTQSQPQPQSRPALVLLLSTAARIVAEGHKLLLGNRLRRNGRVKRGNMNKINNHIVINRQGRSGSEGGPRQMHVQGCRVDERWCGLWIDDAWGERDVMMGEEREGSNEEVPWDEELERE